eukprot:7141512-Alexandrium_andersonii.AAC.1
MPNTRNRFRRSDVELRSSENDLKFDPRRSCPGGSASFRALSPTVTARQAGGRAGGASRGRPGGRSPPGKTYEYDHFAKCKMASGVR